MFDSNARPFTTLLRKLYVQAGTFEDAARRCGHVRSTSWIHALIRSTNPWGVNPPHQNTIAKFALAFAVSEEHVRAAVAQEWYGVGNVSPTPSLESVMPLYEGLTPGQKQVLAALLMELRVNGRNAADLPPGQAA